MADPNAPDSVNLKDRLRCALALSEREAEAVLRGETDAVDPSSIARRTNLSPAEADRLLHSRATIETHRVNPNRATQVQLRAAPGVAPERIRAVLEGRPYFSLAEFEAASGLPHDRAAALFEVPALRVADRFTGKTTTLSPVPGKYVLRPRPEFESAGLVSELGFVELGAGRGAPLRVVARSDAEAVRPVHELKAAFGGDVFPVLRDDEGFERYLVPGSIDVWFERDTPPEQARRILGERNLRVTRSHPRIGYYLVALQDLPADLDLTRAILEEIGRLNRTPGIRLAEADQVGFEDFDPATERALPDFESATAGSRAWNLDMIELAAAHRLDEGSADVTIALIDSGVRLTHPDLAAALRPDWAGLDLNFDVGVPEAEASPAEATISHGTKVASIAGGRGAAPGIGVRGVAPGCWLLPVKISGSPFGQSYGLRAAAILEAINDIGPGGKGVLNLSWSTNGEHIGIREALIEASRAGLAVTASAGNYQAYEPQVADRLHYPSCYAFLPGDTDADVTARRKIRGLASVAAVNASGHKASYSYYGAHAVTVSAPGGEPGQAGTGIYVASTPQDYAYDAGTSMAAPHVAGLIALLLSSDPRLDAATAIEVLRRTADDLDPANPSYVGALGAGLVNARRALESITARTPLPIVPGPGPAVPVPGPAGAAPLNINTATAEDLTALPLVGAWTAAAIVAYRTAQGPYASIWDLALSGALDSWAIGQIQDLIVAGPASPAGAPPPAPGAGPTPTAGAPLNINTASVEDLVALPLIGPWAAERIVADRVQNGPFAAVGDLLRTGAVDAWTVQQLAPLITAF